MSYRDISGDVASRWRRDLESWAIPEEILRAAPESPWGFPTALFARAAAVAQASPEPSPSRARALEALPPGGSVLDIGAGGGAASIPLAPRAGQIVAVDESDAMLDTFSRAASDRGARHQEIAGRWPDVAPLAPLVDVVVCHHVLYNVADLVPFVAALDAHARRRVVVELTASHPLHGLNPLWAIIHGVDRPDVPTASDAARVVAGLGFEVHEERFEQPSLREGAGLAERVALARRRLCVGPERDEEIAAFFEGRSPDEQRRSVVTLWWDTRH